MIPNTLSVMCQDDTCKFNTTIGRGLYCGKQGILILAGSQRCYDYEMRGDDGDMVVAYTVSKKFSKYILPSVTSLLEHNDVRKIYLLTEVDTVPGLPDVCEVINIADQGYIQRLGPNCNYAFPWIARVRICMAKFLKHEKRVLYLDADTIICDDLEPIWVVDLRGKHLAMVNEKFGNDRRFGDKYYNCGVIVMNLEQIREDHVDDEWIRMMNSTFIPLGEQDIFNMDQDKVVELPTRYNEFVMTGRSNRPAIVHYAMVGDWYKRKDMWRGEYLDKYRELLP